MASEKGELGASEKEELGASEKVELGASEKVELGASEKGELGTSEKGKLKSASEPGPSICTHPFSSHEKEKLKKFVSQPGHKKEELEKSASQLHPSIGTHHFSSREKEELKKFASQPGPSISTDLFSSHEKEKLKKFVSQPGHKKEELETSVSQLDPSICTHLFSSREKKELKKFASEPGPSICTHPFSSHEKEKLKKFVSQPGRKKEELETSASQLDPSICTHLISNREKQELKKFASEPGPSICTHPFSSHEKEKFEKSASQLHLSIGTHHFSIREMEELKKFASERGHKKEELEKYASQFEPSMCTHLKSLEKEEVKKFVSEPAHPSICTCPEEKELVFIEEKELVFIEEEELEASEEGEFGSSEIVGLSDSEKALLGAIEKREVKKSKSEPNPFIFTFPFGYFEKKELKKFASQVPSVSTCSSGVKVIVFPKAHSRLSPLICNHPVSSLRNGECRECKLLRADIAVIGVTEMSKNLILNMLDHGYVVRVYDRIRNKVTDFINEAPEDAYIIGANSLSHLVANLKFPRKIMLVIKAEAIAEAIEHLIPRLETDDIIIDAGNGDYKDSNRRVEMLREENRLFVACAISGGEDLARHGPILMVGGAREAWPEIKEIFQNICAKVDGKPCCIWIGSGGCGQFVKMAYNGLEQGDMQLICEAYHLLKDALKLDHDKMAEIFTDWNKGELGSYFFEITSTILKYKRRNGEPLLPLIKEPSGLKGPGKWTASAAVDFGVPVTVVGEAVFARSLAFLKLDRLLARQYLAGPEDTTYKGNKEEFIEDIRKAFYATKIVSYAQGFLFLRKADRDFIWRMNYSAIVRAWMAGNMRSTMLGNIKAAFDRNPSLSSLLLDNFFRKIIDDCQKSWRHVVVTAIELGIPTPAFSSALEFYDGLFCKVQPINLLQAQKDYLLGNTYLNAVEPSQGIYTKWRKDGNLCERPSLSRRKL